MIRANLTPAQEASAVFRRKAIYETLHPETKHGGDRKSDQVGNLHTRSERFTAATSAATGKDESTIRRAAGGNARQGLASDKLSFAENTANTTGKDKRTVERAAARGEALGDDLDGIGSLPCLALWLRSSENFFRRASKGRQASFSPLKGQINRACVSDCVSPAFHRVSVKRPVHFALRFTLSL
ncbi:hypothetical protein [uncultured Rhodoblastus sp.]|uniref:hypothetical protein n=1 Tax=uncultured Rhodoblastus sp. TaxID=543037 RepID=UPI0025EDC59F|nr:hypothetical protein [uncultured Rhodoblastus sp.]